MPNFGEMDSNVLVVQRTHKPSGGIDIISNSQRARLLGVDLRDVRSTNLWFISLTAATTNRMR